MAKMTLQELARTNAWSMQETAQRKKMDSFRGIAVAFTRAKKDGAIGRVQIIFDSDIASKLNVKLGERINILYHPDDLLSFMLCKSSSGKGLSITPYNKSTILFRMQFGWNRPLILNPRRLENVEYLFIEKSKSIIFRVDN